MFEIEKKFRFEAGHQLLHHDGKCSRPHGHSYTLVVKLRSEKLAPSGPKTNMVADFSDVAAAVRPMIKIFFDHQWLNETLETDSPTAEFIAKWIFDHLEQKLPRLHSVSVWETEGSRALYYK